MTHEEPTVCPCHHPKELYFQERVINSASPIIMPRYEYRLLCKNCGRSTPWCETIDMAIRYWNKSMICRVRKSNCLHCVEGTVFRFPEATFARGHFCRIDAFEKGKTKCRPDGCRFYAKLAKKDDDENSK